jgi:predicted Zn-dependent protease
MKISRKGSAPTTRAPVHDRLGRAGRRLLAAALCAVLAPAGALDLHAPVEIELPDIGDSASSALSPREEQRISEELTAAVRRAGVMIEDGPLEDYLNRIGHDIVAHADTTQRFNFFWVNDTRINAFAAPGGAIGVNTGLILNTLNESEFASVLAHEVSHVTQRHGARSIEARGRMSVPMAVAMVGAILAGLANPQAGQAAIAAVTAGSQQLGINFTRANEKEADRIGIQVLARSGFEPRAMAEFFERLQTANRYSDPAAIPEYLRTHPVTLNRIAESRSLAARYPPVRLRDEREFHLMRARTQAYSAERPEDILVHFESVLREGKHSDELAARYGHAIALMRAGEFDRARSEIEELVSEHPGRSDFGLERVEIERRAGRPEVAWQLLEALYQQHPNDRAVVLERADLALATERYDIARRILRDYSFRFEVDARYFRMLAQAEGRGGSKIESRIALAEYYYRLGDLERSLEQLRLAREEGAMDIYQRSRIEARSQEFEVLMAERAERGGGL